MIEGAHDAYMSVDGGGNIHSWNRAATRIFGPAKATALGQNLSLLFPEALLKQLMADVQALLSRDDESAECLRTEGKALALNGVEPLLAISSSRYEHNGQILVMMVMREIADLSQSVTKHVKLDHDTRIAGRSVPQTDFEIRLAKFFSERQEERFATILDQLPAGIATIRASDLVYTSANREFLSLFGNQSLVGRSILEFMISEESQRYLELLKTVISSGKAFHAREVSRTIRCRGSETGVEKFFNIVYDPIFDASNAVSDIIVFCFDVTDLVLARRAVEESEHHFRTLTETLPQIVWMADDKGNILHFNATWYAYTGLPKIKQDQLPWASIIHPDDMALIVTEGENARRENRNFVAEYRIRRHDGSYRWHLGRSINLPMPTGGEGRRIGTATDIHDQKEVQKTIAALKLRTDSVIQDAPVLLWAVDKQGVFTYYDGKLRSVLGISTADRIGKNIFELYAGIDSVAGNVKRALEGQVIRGESQIGAVSLENKFTPQYDSEGKINGVVGLSIDITERKQVEKRLAEVAISAEIAEASSKLKSQFLATMSHEIRTPINGVIGMAGLLLDLVQGNDERSYVAAIQRSGENLLNIVNDILDFSKIEAGKVEFEDAPFRLADVFKDLQKSLRYSLTEKNLELMFELASDLPEQVSGDCGRFTQIVLNLVSNAIKFTSEGKILVRVARSQELGEGHRIKVEVIDSGIGIAADSLSRLFQPFTQADASTARRYGGTGLGLSICKGLVENMGGEIGVQSVIGSGSTFWFTCAFKAVASASVQSSVKSSAAEAMITDAKILIAEDNLINQVVAVKMVEKFGFRADVVANGREALEALAKGHYDLILMDCHMPEMDGYEATRQIRKSETLRDPLIPIIAMTANAMEGDAEKCLAAGMTDYVSKPVKPQVLQDAIQRNLKKVREKGG